MKDRLEYGHVLPKQIELIFSYEDIEMKLGRIPLMHLMNFEAEVPNIDTSNKLEIRVFENNTFYNSLDLLEKDVLEWKKANKKIVILAGIRAKAERLIEELEHRQVSCNNSEQLAFPIT